jgi:hypothetical protein
VRIPFPVYIPFWQVACFATVLSGVQLLQKTSPFFAICSFLFVIVAGITFNMAGGLSRPSGAYVFFYAVLGVLVGLCWKAVLGEPGDSNLQVPQQTILVFLGGMIAMYIAVFCSRRLTLRKPLLGTLVTDANMQNATVGCMVTGLVVSAIVTFVPHESGGFLSALTQVNRFLPMALILGVVHQIRRSGGTSCISVPVIISAGAIFVLGLMGFSKEGIFTPLACWLAAAGSQRYRLSRTQLVVMLFGVFLMFRYLVPYSQYGRNFTADSVLERAKISAQLLGDLDDVRSKSNQVAEEANSAQKQGYFNTPQGFADRLQMLSVDDALIRQTDEEGAFGLSPIIVSFENLVPHFIWPDKPSIGFGNLFAHQLGGLSEDDFTTGISFSPSGEAYHMARWLGVFLVAPLLWVMLFTLFDSLCGDTANSPWGLLMVAYFSHVAPEGMLDGVVYAMGYMAFGVVMAAMSATYLMPMIGSLVKGPEKLTSRRIAPIRPVSRATPSRIAGQ